MYLAFLPSTGNFCVLRKHLTTEKAEDLVTEAFVGQIQLSLVLLSHK